MAGSARGQAKRPTRIILKRQNAVAALADMGWGAQAISVKLGYPLSTVKSDLRIVRKYGTPDDPDVKAIRATLTAKLLEAVQQCDDADEKYVRDCKRGKTREKRGEPSFDFLNIAEQLLGAEGALNLLDENKLMVTETRKETFIPSPSQRAALFTAKIKALQIALAASGVVTPEGQAGSAAIFNQCQIALFGEKAQLTEWEKAATAYKDGKAVALIPCEGDKDGLGSKDPSKK